VKYYAKLEKDDKITLPKELTEEIRRRGLVLTEGLELDIRLHSQGINKWQISIRPTTYEAAETI
jgi:hypothetical protein